MLSEERHGRNAMQEGRKRRRHLLCVYGTHERQDEAVCARQESDLGAPQPERKKDRGVHPGRSQRRLRMRCQVPAVQRRLRTQRCLAILCITTSPPAGVGRHTLVLSLWPSPSYSPQAAMVSAAAAATASVSPTLSAVGSTTASATPAMAPTAASVAPSPAASAVPSAPDGPLLLWTAGIAYCVFDHLTPSDLLMAASVSHAWRDALHDPGLWRRAYLAANIDETDKALALQRAATGNRVGWKALCPSAFARMHSHARGLLLTSQAKRTLAQRAVGTRAASGRIPSLNRAHSMDSTSATS